MEIFPMDGLFKKNTMGNNIFHEIAIEGSLLMLRRIRDNVNEQMDTYLSDTNDQGETCIVIAADRHRGRLAIELIEIFVGLGADINGTDNEGNTALHYTVFNEDHALASWLYQQPGINLNAANHDELTPLGLAIQLNIQGMKAFLDFLEAARAVLIEWNDSDDDDDDEDDDDDDVSTRRHG
ncbi:GfV-B55-ORF1 [Ichnoviriform fumiferanae]|uniref:GfV-B55-ORF1 n=1 Tax=Ichnoviriform fumiferanae TaxID=419435 RepID=A2PZV2_9VIRU|nr:GfV-B55-ORF1 [Ichnoviriform fumiferanae]BAF45524.1 GfV-B55-ORF1 [Ichnoviriform fumiferanae]